MRGPEIPRATMALFALTALFLPSASAQKEKEGQERRADDPQAMQQWLHFKKLQQAPPMRMAEWRPGQACRHHRGWRYNPATGEYTDIPCPRASGPGCSTTALAARSATTKSRGADCCNDAWAETWIGIDGGQAATPPGPTHGLTVIHGILT